MLAPLFRSTSEGVDESLPGDVVREREEDRLLCSDIVDVSCDDARLVGVNSASLGERLDTDSSGDKET